MIIEEKKHNCTTSINKVSLRQLYTHVSSEKYMYNDNDIYILMNNSRPTCCESHRPGLM